MPDIMLLRDFAVVMVIAGGITLLFRQLRQPPILGYLLAGLIVGPYTPPTSLIGNAETIRLLADLGIVLLLFSIGLEFTWDRLRSVGLIALVIGAIEIPFMLAIGHQLSRLLGWPLLDTLFLTAALSISSSAIISKTLRDLGRLKLVSSRLIIGILVVEDFAAIAMIAILSGVTTTGQVNLASAGMILFKLAIFALTALAFGRLAVPRLIHFTYGFHSRESLLVVSLALCFALSLFSQYLGLSVAVGAFLMGVLVGESPHAEEVSQVMNPIRDLFAALFFVSIGMLIDISLFRQFLIPALAISLVFIVGKALANSLGVFITGHGGKTPLRVGLAMGQMGEFSLFIVKFGRDLNAIGPLLYPIVAIATVITTFTSAYLTGHTDSVIQRLDSRTPQPVRRFTSYMGEWLGALRARFGREDAPARAARHSIMGVLVNTIIIGLFLGGGALALPLVEGLATAIHLSKEVLTLALGFIVLALCFPPGLTIWRHLRSLLNEATGYLVGCRPSARNCGSEGVRVILRDSLGLLVLGLLTVLSLPFLLSFLWFKSLLAVIPLTILAVVVYLFWGATRQIHGRIEMAFRQTLLGVAEPGDEAPAPPKKEAER